MTSYRELEKNGRRVATLDEQPTVFRGNEWLFDSFLSLDTCRYVGMSQGPIPWTAAMDYARVQGFGEEETEIMWRVLHRADTGFRSYVAEKNRT